MLHAVCPNVYVSHLANEMTGLCVGELNKAKSGIRISIEFENVSHRVVRMTGSYYFAPTLYMVCIYTIWSSSTGHHSIVHNLTLHVISLSWTEEEWDAYCKLSWCVDYCVTWLQRSVNLDCWVMTGYLLISATKHSVDIWGVYGSFCLSVKGLIELVQ